MKPVLLRLPVAGAALGLFAESALSQGTDGHGWMWNSGWGWGGMMGGGLGMVLFWGLIILVIVFAVRGLGGFGTRRDFSAPSEKTPLQILQERFARGEIDKQEYDERRKMLGG